MPNFVVNSLPDYVANNRELILKNFGLVGTATRRRIGIQTGIKKSAYLNYLEMDPTLQDASACGYSAEGTATLTQRTIEVSPIKVNLDICPKTLIGKWGEYLVRINANEQSLPFEQYVIDGVVAEINKKIEKLIWQGDKTSLDANLKWIDGLLTQFAADTDVTSFSITATTAFAGLVEVYAKMDDVTLDKGGMIFVEPAIYRAFLMDIVKLNYFHYAGPADASFPEEFYLPGTNVKVVLTPGLAGSLKVVGSFASNFVYGTDFENDEEDILLDYDKKSKTYSLVAEWASGIAYAFPDKVVVGTFSAAPAITA